MTKSQLEINTFKPEQYSNLIQLQPQKLWYFIQEMYHWIWKVIDTLNYSF